MEDSSPPIQPISKRVKLRFPAIVLAIGLFFFLAIYLLYTGGLVTQKTEIYFRYSLIGLFLLSIISFFLFSGKQLDLFKKQTKKEYSLLLTSLMLLPIATLFSIDIGNYATGIFVGCALLYFILNRKLYQFNKIYLYLFLYAGLMTVGTIGTTKGFRFPDTALSFLVLPIAYTFFNLPRETLFKIAHFVFRAMIIYMVISVLYWWFNFLHLDSNFLDWITSKQCFNTTEMMEWENQTFLALGTLYGAHFFVTSWAYYYHPSYITLVLFFGLILGLYLLYKKKPIQTVTKFEIFSYVVLLFLLIALMESRIGLVNLLVILCATALYYIKLEASHFKTALITLAVIASASLFIMDDRIESFVFDNVRKTDYTLATNYIKDHFWWGTGFDEQKIGLTEQEELMKDVLPPIGRDKTYTHNQLLGNMVQYGIWGALVLIVFLVALIRYAVKTRSYLLQMFLLTIILFMMIEEPLYGQKGFTIFTVFLTFFIAVGESDKPRKSYIFDKGNISTI
ncbi:MAG TPA: O-antigen ligase family protein [Bacteroidales bacterium]|nr:O-antigen ligase family protein [Bacteroidales bacterium]